MDMIGEIERSKFEARLEAFVPALQAFLDKYDQGFMKTDLRYRVIELERGQKFIRVVEKRINGGAGRSVYCFLDLQGNIYKSASWKAPAKHIRGSIFDEGFSLGKALGPYGAVYLR